MQPLAAREEKRPNFLDVSPLLLMISIVRKVAVNESRFLDPRKSIAQSMNDTYSQCREVGKSRDDPRVFQLQARNKTIEWRKVSSYGQRLHSGMRRQRKHW